jgi:tripartite-type tricarboxylate transporter receptor subunit TctC
VQGSDDKLLMRDAVAPMALGRPLIMPPGVPPDRLAIMRAAFEATLHDPGFLAVARKLGSIVDAPQSGEALERVVDQTYASPSRVVDRLRKIENPSNR